MNSHRSVKNAQIDAAANLSIFSAFRPKFKISIRQKFKILHRQKFGFCIAKSSTEIFPSQKAKAVKQQTSPSMLV